LRLAAASLSTRLRPVCMLPYTAVSPPVMCRLAVQYSNITACTASDYGAGLVAADGASVDIAWSSFVGNGVSSCGFVGSPQVRVLGRVRAWVGRWVGAGMWRQAAVIVAACATAWAVPQALPCPAPLPPSPPPHAEPRSLPLCPQHGGGISVGVDVFTTAASCGSDSSFSPASVRLQHVSLRGNLATDSGGGVHAAAGIVDMQVRLRDGGRWRVCK